MNETSSGQGRLVHPLDLRGDPAWKRAFALHLRDLLGVHGNMTVHLNENDPLILVGQDVRSRHRDQ